MNKDQRDSSEIVTGSSHALAQRSAALVSRGLRDLSGWDAASFVELGKSLTSSLQLDQVLRTIKDKMEQFLRTDFWYLLLLEESKQELYVELAVGKDSEALKDLRVKLGQGIAGWVAQNGEAVIVPDVRKDPRFLPEVDGWPKIETQSIVAVPLRFQERCLGVIGLVNCIGPQGFSQTDLSLLHALADFSAIALENARYIQRVHRLTITDEQTTLYNFRHLSFILDTEITRSERYGYEFSILWIALDGLRESEQSLTYARFTRLLTELGQTFKNHTRLIDFAFYSGNGEFVVLLPQTPKEVGNVFAQRINKLFRESLWLQSEGTELRLPARMTVATFPEDGKTRAELLRTVDEAM